MKKLILTIMFILLLTGCSKSFESEKMNGYIDKIENYSLGILLGNNDIGVLEQVIDEYNQELQNINTDNKDIKEFIDYQIQANELRIVAIQNDDGDLITESSRLQYLAINKLEEIKDAE